MGFLQRIWSYDTPKVNAVIWTLAAISWTFNTIIFKTVFDAILAVVFIIGAAYFINRWYQEWLQK